MVFGESSDQLTDLNDLLRIQADCGLIQDDDLRETDERTGKPDTLAVTFGKVFDESVFDRLQTYQADHLVKLCTLDAFVDEFQSSHKLQVFQNCHVHVKGRLLRQIADIPLGLVRFCEDIVPVDEYLALGGPKVPCHDIHSCGFPCAVGPEESIDLSLLDGKIQVIYSHVIAVVFHQISDFDQSDASFRLQFLIILVRECVGNVTKV